VDDYYSGMDVHYSSGIFNKAFYLIATTAGWNTKMAFDIFVKANQDYWTPSTNFQQGAEGALDAALDYGYSCCYVRNAFAVVGISLTCPSCQGTITNPGFEEGSGSTTGWTETGNVSITNDSRTGSYAVRLTEDNSSVEQVVCGLAPNTCYTVSCWAKALNNAKVYLGVKNYGGEEKTVQVKDNNYDLQEITFTTGATNCTVTIFFIKKNSNNSEPGTADDFAIVTN
jgi:hypothetical protein